MFLGIVMLAGCTTQEVRKDIIPKNELSFYEHANNKTSDVSQEKATQLKEASEQPFPVNKPATKNAMYTQPPAMMLNKDKQYEATLKTDAGNIGISLTAKETPITVNSFVFLAREKFYDNTIFHRVIKGFMIQGGDPEGTGMGGPGYQVVETPAQNTRYTRGVIAMAKSGTAPAGASGSQFFIMHQDNALPPDYVVFGTVISGMEAVDAIADVNTKPGGEGSSPVTPVKIQTIEIQEK